MVISSRAAMMGMGRVGDAVGKKGGRGDMGLPLPLYCFLPLMGVGVGVFSKSMRCDLGGVRGSGEGALEEHDPDRVCFSPVLALLFGLPSQIAMMS